MGKDVIIACDFADKETCLEFLDRFEGKKPFVKIGMELSKRKGNFENLCRLGFSLEQLKRIIKKEMICFYGVILLLPLSYQIIILCNLLLRAKITFYLFLIILIIQIVPLFISYLLSIKLYKGILPTSIIMEK